MKRPKLAVPQVVVPRLTLEARKRYTSFSASPSPPKYRRRAPVVRESSEEEDGEDEDGDDEDEEEEEEGKERTGLPVSSSSAAPGNGQPVGSSHADQANLYQNPRKRYEQMIVGGI